MTNAFIRPGPDGQRFVLADAETVDEMQASGAWIATTDPVECEP